ncbi:MAG TPA: NHLP bacteriocin export ABC transporter permease/ATPase subunit [Chloroflexota bacterium]|jgi:ATP-binding cassette subfamily C protein
MSEPSPPAARVPEHSRKAPRAEESGSSDWELFLLRLRYREGRLVTISGNKPILLDDSDTAWVVFSGHAEVFAVPVVNGEPVGARRHLFSAPNGAALFGMDLSGAAVGLLVSAAPGTQLLRIRRSGLEQVAANAQFASWVPGLVDDWVSRVADSVLPGLPPREFTVLQPGAALDLPVDGVARSPAALLWVRHEEGSSRYLGRPELPSANGVEPVPLSPRGWLEAEQPARLVGVETAQLVTGEGWWAVLQQFHALALAALGWDAARREQAERERFVERARDDESQLAAACARLAAVLTPEARGWGEIDTRTPLLAACQLVGHAVGVPIRPPQGADRGTHTAPLRAIAEASQLRVRRAALRGAWWQGESGPLVGYREGDEAPLALLPRGAGGYEAWDPVARTRRRVDAALAATLSPFADMLYRPFPARALGLRDLVAFGMKGAQAEAGWIVAMGLAVGLLGLITPQVTSSLFDLVIPGAHRALLFQIGLGLVIAAAASALFGMVRDLAVLRLSGRMDGAIQAAVMDRLLELPTPFFRGYSAGDLGSRALGIDAIRQVLSQSFLSVILSSVFSIVSFVQLFIFDVRLALVATGLVLVLIAVVLVSTVIQVRQQRVIADQGGRLSGAVLQLLNGISKLRVAGAEGRAFAYWAARFAEQRRNQYQARTVANVVGTFNVTYNIITSMVVFGVVALMFDPKPSIGTFLGFNAAFGQFMSAMLGIAGAISGVLQVVPTFERAKPILESLPEVDQTKSDPGELSGQIEIDHVSFRYEADGPLVLDDVSLTICPAEFVALVGASGSGKSTLLRLLLGFDTPEAGTILYDGRDLATLDPRGVRRQIGSVLQNGRLMAGDVFSNIVGSATLTQDDAWEAARMAGLDADIRAMPMGLQTVLGDGATTLSGGQRQRLMIARAIVHRPRMLLFDEATSALDNRTQEIVSKSLENLAATRVVVAHRLSTVVNADRIYVMQRGRIVEQGSYRELMQRRGVFAELARRQIA